MPSALDKVAMLDVGDMLLLPDEARRHLSEVTTLETEIREGIAATGSLKTRGFRFQRRVTRTQDKRTLCFFRVERVV